MFLTDDLAAVGITVVEHRSALMLSHLLAAALVQGIRPVPQLLRHDSWDGWVRIHNPLVLLQEDFPLAAVVHRLGFIRAVPALVLGVAEDVSNGQDVEGIALAAGETLAVQHL